MKPTDAFQGIAAAAGCPHIGRTTSLTDRPPEKMCPADIKAEYYGVLRANLETFIGVFRSIRERFPLGLVRLADNGELTSTLDEGFEDEAERLLKDPDFMQILHHVYGRTAETMRAAGVLWKAEMEKDGPHPAYDRMSQLISPQLRGLYGPDAVQVRVARAAELTLNIGFSFQRLIELLSIRDAGRPPSPEEMITRFSNSLKLGRQFATMHQDTLLALRASKAIKGDKGVHVEEFRDTSLFEVRGNTLELNETAALQAVRFEDVDTTDGRYTCPGMRYISELWTWNEELSERFVWPRFNEDVK